MIPITFFKVNALNKTIQFPTEWDELCFEELAIIGNAYFYNKFTPVEVFIEILQLRLAKEIGIKEAKEIIAFISIEDVALEYIELLDFIKKEILLTKNTINIENAISPADDFNDITVGLFEECDILFNQFVAGDATKLNEFFIELFQCKKEMPGIATNDQMIVAALYFIGCKNQLPNLFPLVFPQDEEDKKVNQYNPMALTKLIHELAGPKNGTREQVRKTLLKEFLFECQLEAEKQPDVY